MSLEISFHQTPLVQEHIALGAKMVGFGGWNMPLQYESILAEWGHNRKTCSIFDCSHMGEFVITGDAVGTGLDAIVTQPIVDMPLKACRYGAMLNGSGGMIDDLIVYRKAQEEWMVVVNAANIEKDSSHFRAHLRDTGCFKDVSFQTAKLDLQGPLSRDVLKVLAPDITKLSYYAFDEFTLDGAPCLISRTGYTGELGYEIYCPWEKAKDIWKTILKNDTVKPTGLGARDVLRVEMCYALYGHELSEDISPVQAGLRRQLDLTKDFIGKPAVQQRLKQGVDLKIGYFVSNSRRSPRAGHMLFRADGQACGQVCSGTFSPGLQSGIGIGFLRGDLAVGDSISFGDVKTQAPAVMAQRPFYKDGSLKH